MSNSLTSKLYSIRINGSQDLKSSSKVNAYELGVSKVIIQGIATRRTGRIILNAIHCSKWFVEIRPFLDPGCNASTDLIEAYDRMESDGVAVLVRYSPGMFGGSGKCFVDPQSNTPLPGGAQEEVLFHELVHAFRMVYGKNDSKPLKSSPHYTNKEDFFAVVITNIFASETNRPLRASHQGHDLLMESLSTDEGFLKLQEYSSMVREFVTAHRSVSDELRDVPCKFNPIRGVLVGQGFQYL